MIFLLSLILSFSLNAKNVEEAFFVIDPEHKQLELLKRHNFTIDHLEKDRYELYGPKGTKEILKSLKISFSPQALSEKSSDYPSPEEIEKKLKSLSKRYPQLIHLFSIGKSVEGRELWVVKISDHPKKDEQEPKFKYVANMHGDEIVGRELMVKFIEDLAQNYSSNARIKNLIDHTQIYILPSLNPDGANKRRRGNAKNVDLNRDFPDFTTRDNQNTPIGRQPETIAMMNFQKKHNFLLSANFHGGAVVVNYPWDTTANPFPKYDLIKELSQEYADSVLEMRNSRRFPGGIVNGHKWYEVDGGMQDWSYHWHKDLQVTIELSDRKWPSYSKIENYYREHREALLRYVERVHDI